MVDNSAANILYSGLCVTSFFYFCCLSIIKVSQVQHVDHKPRVRANGPKLLLQLYACRHGLNPIGIKREKDAKPPY